MIHCREPKVDVHLTVYRVRVHVAHDVIREDVKGGSYGRGLQGRMRISITTKQIIRSWNYIGKGYGCLGK